MRTVAFWHVVTINNWVEIVYEQLGKMHASGLYDYLDDLFVTVLGDPLPGWMSLGNKARILYTSPDRLEYEIATMRVLDAWVKSLTPHEPTRVLYLHVKGAGREDLPSQFNVSFWRRYMEYFVLERWDYCWRALAGCDACGVDLNFNPWPHFSGNMWWAWASYLQTLPNAAHLSKMDPVRAELRIGESSREMSLHELWHSGRNLYAEKILPHEYRGQIPRMPQGIV